MNLTRSKAESELIDGRVAKGWMLAFEIFGFQFEFWVMRVK